MPQYLFERASTGETREVFYHMNDEKNYKGENGEENDWKRIFVAPQASIDTKNDPFSESTFINNTKGHGTVGDMMDRSTEASERRASQNGGVDPVREKYYKDYSKKRGGKLHPKQVKEKIEKTVIDV